MAISEAEHRRLVQSVSRETAKCVSKNVAEKAVHETLVSVGIDPSDPIAAQETQTNMRRVAAVAPALEAIAEYYADEENREAMRFAKNAHRFYKSGRNRAVVGASVGIITVWTTGLWNKIMHMIG